MTSADRDSSATVLRELCPDATSEQISQSLNNSKGDVNLAAEELLGSDFLMKPQTWPWVSTEINTTL